MDQLMHATGQAGWPLSATAPEAATEEVLNRSPAVTGDDLSLLAPVGQVVLEPDATIITMNMVAADLLGLSRTAGGRVSLRRFITARYLDDFDRFLQRAANSRQMEHCALQMVGTDPRGCPVTLHAIADSAGHTLRLMLEPAEGRLAMLEHSEQRMRRIVHCAEEGIWEIDRNARTSFVNPKMAQMLGYSIEDMLGQPLLAFMDAEGRSILEQHIARRQHGGLERYEFKFVRQDGGALWTTLVSHPIYDTDDVYVGALALVSDITASRAAVKRLWQQVHFDALTTLPNRLLLEDRLGQEIKKALRASQSLALLLIELDGVRQASATLGPAVSDPLLIEAARRISACVRDADTVARLDGDAFCVILPAIDPGPGIERIASVMLARLNQPFILDTGTAVLSASIGIALYPSDAVTGAALFQRAEQAMVAAKAAGSGRYRYGADALQRAAQAREQLSLGLRTALAEQQLVLYFQPIVTLSNGAVERAEALLRWQHPQRGLLAASDFLPQAEAAGLLIEIGDWVFRQAALQARLWQDSLGAGFQVSINLGATQCRAEDGLYHQWLSYAAALQLAPRSIMLEINEADLSDDVAALAQQWRALGLQVALANFGADHSSLSQLKRAGIDLLKLDRNVIGQLATDTGELALCEAVIGMAHKLGLQVVAEGVETALQSDLLALAGCDYAQGYRYAAALPAAELEALVQRGAGQFPNAN